MAYRMTPLLGLIPPSAYSPSPTGSALAFIPGAASVLSIGSSIANAQAQQRRTTKLAADIATAHSRGSLADQSFLQYTSRTGATRYEFDNLVAPLVRSAVDHASMDALRSSGLFTEPYIQSLEWVTSDIRPDAGRGPLFTGQVVTVQPTGPAGASPSNPTGPGSGSNLILPFAIAAGVGLLALATMRHH